MRTNIKMYKYERGEYSCLVSISEDEHCVFSNIKVPKDTQPDVVDKMLTDAERMAMELHQEGVARKWNNG